MKTKADAKAPCGEDRLRFTIATVNGRLAFTEFSVEPCGKECPGLEITKRLKQFLEGKPIEEIRYEDLVGFRCEGSGACLQAIVDALAESIEFFGPQQRG